MGMKFKKYATGACVLGFIIIVLVYFPDIKITLFENGRCSVILRKFMTNPKLCTLESGKAAQYPRASPSPVSVDECAKWRRNPTGANLSLTSQVWVRSDTAADIFVYSAYYDVDDDNVPVIRVIGIGSRMGTYHVISLVQWSADSTCLEDRPATVEIMPDHHWKRYSAMFVMCKLNVSESRKPFAVSIAQANTTQLKHKLLVKYPEPFRFNITVCLPCIHSKYNDETETIQSIEMDQTLGVEHFVVYNYSIGDEVKNVVNYYFSQGILEINVWNLPEVEVHYFGQLAAVNDCVYSNRGKSKYVIVKDLDEVLVPYKDKTLPTLINRMMANEPLAGAIMFRSTFFHKEWPDDMEGFEDAQRAKQFHLYTLLKTWRETKIWDSQSRSKMISLPNRVHIQGIHYVLKMRKGFVETEVDTKEGLVHHYREWSATTDKMKETFLRVFSDLLIDKCNRTFHFIHRNSVIKNG
ncbi:beta-1,4-galactosyltransferase galt-1-like [Gigantopelta aegis]|uniref:beta-1,4-galactosyltransferase galt-1-like n=1 Tax=Gigantopelta aegis TaxID=1735272 RepID=UPI001B88E3E0|nr:beta-1,4-galactosyltransferase galt-1-like [Gigantopelta aegis]